jgi:hypothetical protein
MRQLLELMVRHHFQCLKTKKSPLLALATTIHLLTFIPVRFALLATLDSKLTAWIAGIILIQLIQNLDTTNDAIMKLKHTAITAMLIWSQAFAEPNQAGNHDKGLLLPPGVPRTVDTNGNVIYVNHRFTTDLYRNYAVNFLLQEANQVAQELNLSESLPITKTNIVKGFISPFGFAYESKALGDVSTTNYDYGAEKDFKFNSLTITKLDNRCRELAVNYLLPIEKLDTKGAYQLATQWLTALRVDVKGLNRDYNLRINVDPYWNNIKMGQLPKGKFTPIYYVSWLTKGKKAYSAGGGAEVQLFLPTKTLLQLTVDKSKYILREPLAFTNLDALFPGKATITTNWPVETKVIDASLEFRDVSPK